MPPGFTIDVRLEAAERRAMLLADARSGLTATPRTLSPFWFYDERGSQLFDEITRLPEYYPTRAERSLLDRHAAEIARLSGADTLVELGSGTSDKTRLLLAALEDAGDLARYVALDVDEAILRQAGATLVEEHPDLAVHAVVGDFHRHLGSLPRVGARLVAFLGGTIGNLDPDERHRFLTELRAVSDPGDHLLLGVDLAKDPARLVAAYDDAAGVTAAFNRNALRHLGRELGAAVDPDDFDHVARWDPEHGWIELWLRARAAVRFHVAALDLDVELAAGEAIRTEISAKLTPEGVADELAAAGFGIEQAWVHELGFLLALAAPS